MNISNILDILNNGKTISQHLIKDLEDKSQKFPYSPLFQSLLLKAYKLSDNINYNQQLFTTATIVPNRNDLKSFIDGEIKRKSEIKHTDGYNIEDLINDDDSTEILNQQQKQDRSLIDRFITEPKKQKQNNSLYTPEKAAENSLNDDNLLITETLAEIYIKQKQFDKAIKCFEALGLKYPEKNTYFATRIKKLNEEN